jgi:O-acetyl-ADP-ribose deacetylase (regulator of RNase III)
MSLHYIIGDATEPIGKPAVVCHVCNDINGWGRGFVIALSKKNKGPEEAYHRWYRDDRATFALGAIQIVSFAEGVKVANMIAQHDVRWDGKIPPIRYDALEQCLESVYRYCSTNKSSLHMPRIGADLAGGDWPTIEAIIKKVMTVETFVYTLEAQKDRWPTQYKSIDDLKTESIVSGIAMVLDEANNPSSFKPINMPKPPETLTDEDLSNLFK